MRPSLSPALAPADAVARLERLARALPPIHRAGFECRLDAGDPRVDLQQGIFASDGESDALIGCIDRAERDAPRPLSPAWLAVRRLCEAWRTPASVLHSALSEMWLEFDVPAADAGEARDTPPVAHEPLEMWDVVPSVFALFRPPDPGIPTSASLAECVLRLLVDEREAARLAPLLARCSEACPDGVRVTHVGVMLGRAHAGFRVHVSPLAIRDFPVYLERVGWPANASEVQRVARALMDYVDDVVLCLDVGASVMPQLGLESFFQQKHGVDPRWEPLLRHLVDTGLCTPDKRDALQQWPGFLPPGGPAPWPDDLLIASLTRPRDQLGIFDRRLSHVKLAYAPGAPLRAKAYFGYGHLWLGRAPGVDDAPRPSVVATRPARRPTTPLTITALDGAIARSIRFLLRARNQAGWWRDFYDLARATQRERRVTGFSSDEWVTAYVGAMLASVPDPSARAAASEAWELLAARREVPAGWGYHAQLPPDADSTVWALRLARAIGAGESDRTRAALSFVARQTRADGGVVCYREADCPQIAHFLRMDGPYDGWCTAHTCVTAAAAALAPTPSMLDYLRRTQHGDGRWTGHWWDDDEYATARAIEALARDRRGGHDDAVARGIRWAASRVSARGSVYSACHDGESVFATALALTSLCASAETSSDVRAARDRASAWLVEEQRQDGSFPPSSRLRVPAPAAVDPLASPETTLVYLDREAIFTTATALAALAAARASYEREAGGTA